MRHRTSDVTVRVTDYDEGMHYEATQFRRIPEEKRTRYYTSGDVRVLRIYRVPHIHGLVNIQGVLWKVTIQLCGSTCVRRGTLADDCNGSTVWRSKYDNQFPYFEKLAYKLRFRIVGNIAIWDIEFNYVEIQVKYNRLCMSALFVRMLFDRALTISLCEYSLHDD